MIQVYMHKETGDLAISFQVYGYMKQDDPIIPSNMSVGTYQYIGVALENSSGLTSIWHESVLKNFFLIGDL